MTFNKTRAKHNLLALWGKVIRARDKKCQWCGRKEGKLDGHHIISKSRCSYSGMFDLNNGVCLCFRCHRIRMESHSVEYRDWVMGWLHDRNLDYYRLRQTYEGAKTYFNKETYEIKKKIMEEILEELTEKPKKKERKKKC